MKRKVSILFLLRFIRVSLSVVSLSLSAKFFGISIQRDYWVLAFNCIIVLDLAVWGPINETFRAKFIFLRDELGEEVTLNKTRTLLRFNLVTSALVALILGLFSKSIASVISPSYNQNQLIELGQFILLFAPYLLINQLSLLLTSILNAYNSFYIPEISGVLSTIVNIILLYVLSSFIGVKALIVNYYVSQLIMVLLLVIELKKRKVPLFRFRWSGTLGFKEAYPFLRYALPFFIPYFFAQLNIIIEKSISSGLGSGAVSLVDYARKFTDIPISVLTSVMTTMMVPTLSTCFVSADRLAFNRSFGNMYQLGILLITLLFSVLVSSGVELSSILYLRGVMTAEGVSRISQLAMYYGGAAIAIFLYLIFGLTLMSCGKGKLYAYYGALAQVLMIGINIIYYKQMGVYIFPIALGVSHFLAAILMLRSFPYRIQPLYRLFLKYSVVLVCVASGAFLIRGFHLDLSIYLIFAIKLLLLLLAMLFCGFLFRLEEWDYAVKLMRNIRKRAMGSVQ